MRFEEENKFENEVETNEVFEEENVFTTQNEKNEELVSVKVESETKQPSRPGWFGVIIIAIIFSLVFGAGGGYLGYRLGVLSEKTVIITQPVPTTEIGEGVYYNGVVDVVNKVGPAVVSISVETLEMVIDQRSYFWGFEPDHRKRTTTGSGVIIENIWTEDEGYIVTNNHVVEGKQAKITVTLKDKRELKATVIGRDEMSDIAVLKVSAKKLPVARLGDSKLLKVGEPVIAIGNPYEFDHTVTTGVISATERIVRIPEVVNPQPTNDLFGFGFSQSREQEVKYKTLWGAIQTDAAINPGNSGGPLVTLKGEVIGINSIKREGDNIGFAVSSDIVKRVVSDLIKFGRISWPYIGIKGGNLTEDIANKLEIDFIPGVIVAEVGYGPAREADILIRDIITKIGDTEVTTMEELLVVTRRYRVGDEVEIELFRNGKKMIKKVTLDPYPDSSLQ